MVTPSFEEMIEKTHRALKEFYKGDPKPYMRLFSNRTDVSLLGAFGGISVGSEESANHATQRASYFQEGKNLSFESLVKYSKADLGYTVEVERFEAKIGGTADIVRVALRATTIFRRENGVWKVAHRIGDPLVSRIDPTTYRSLAKHNEKTAE